MFNRNFLILLLFTTFILSACGAPVDSAAPDAGYRASGSNFQPAATPLPSGNVILPESLEYLGAFRLPGGWDRPETFAYGGNAMTINPDGDPGGAADGFPGSLFIMGHDRMPYGDLPDGSQVAEVAIPEPYISRDLEALNTAAFLQVFQEVARGFFSAMDEIPKAGMQYLNHPATGPKIHLAWGQHLQPPDQPSHAWFDPNLASPDMQGAWFIGSQDLYAVNGYMLDIPADWAEAYTGGRMLATGRMRDGGQGGMGPTLFAYTPWQPDGSPPPDGTHLEEVTLLLYENAYATDEIVRALNGYQHPDEWEGGAWLNSPDGRGAMVFAGTKASGEKYWYGYIHPDGAQYACVDAAVTDFQTCRMADGSPCPAADLQGCCSEESGSCVSYRGWWSTRFDAQLIFYDLADLARVAAGELEPWQPQPYAVLDIDDVLYLTPPEWDLMLVGWGDQRRYRIGDVAYDRENGLLYVLELFVDEAKPVVHVWRQAE
jgi:hypothetical protein